MPGKSKIGNKVYSLIIGRFQPLHQGHIKLIRTVLDEGKDVLIAIRNTKKNENNPYSVEARKEMFYREFMKEIREYRMEVIVIPDIKEVVHGRAVGWGIRQIRLDRKTEAISATEIRKGK